MRSWQSHSNVNEHQIPDFKGSAVRPRSWGTLLGPCSKTRRAVVTSAARVFTSAASCSKGDADKRRTRLLKKGRAAI